MISELVGSCFTGLGLSVSSKLHFGTSAEGHSKEMPWHWNLAARARSSTLVGAALTRASLFPGRAEQKAWNPFQA